MTTPARAALLILAAAAALWIYACNSFAFENGKQLLAARSVELAEILFRLDRAAARVQFITDPMGLGMFLRDRGNELALSEEYRTASDRYLEEAVATFEWFSGKGDLEESEALSFAALTLIERSPFGPAERAEPLLRRAITIRDQRLGVDRDDTMTLIYSLADLLLRHWRTDPKQQGLLDEARALSDRLQANAHKRNVEEPRWLELCGDVAAAQKRWQDAEQCYRSAMSAYRNQPLDMSGIVAEKLEALLRAQGRSAEADEILKGLFKFGRAKF